MEERIMSAVETALVVDDDFLMRDFVIESLRREKIVVTEAGDGQEACNLMMKHDFDLAFIDLKMPGISGIDVLKHMQRSGKTTIPVIMTAFGTIERAVEAVKNGAYDFLMKPFSPEQVSIVVSRARELLRLRSQNRYLQEELGLALPGGRRIIGSSPAVREMLRQIEKVAQTDAYVLVEGESGTGKELVGLAIHSLSSRKDAPFVRLNCAAVPESLMDSELFGHERGAFTGAVERRMGRFELADGGTLLLDEIGEMNIGVQAKLLRVLQEGEFERVGGGHTIRVNTRVIAATNRNLKEQVAAGTFRQDLFYRLNVVSINVPALRERITDIPLLADAFLNRACKKRREVPCFSKEALQQLMEYTWPGNVRELGNLVEHLCVMEEGPVFDVDVLPSAVRGILPSAPDSGIPSSSLPRDHILITNNLEELERQVILRVLCEKDGNRGLCASDLGISVRTLHNKLNKYREEGILPAKLC
jgi:two-component system response regulator AtoC